MELSSSHVDFILSDLQNKGIASEDLRLDLLDHICCLMESDKSSDDFDGLYAQYLPRFFEKDLKEIQDETDLLIRFSNYYVMKKFMFISGGISTALFTLGCLFKVMHWPGAAVLLVSGAAFMCLFFLPTIFFNSLKENKMGLQTLRILIAVVFGIVITTSIVFKVMHWPFANILWTTSMVLLAFVYLPVHIIQWRRSEEKNTSMYLAALLIFCAVALLFTLTNLQPSERVSNARLESVAQEELTLAYLNQNEASLLDSAERTVLNQIHLVRKKLKTRLFESEISDEEAVERMGNNITHTTHALFDQNQEACNELQVLAKAVEGLKSNSSFQEMMRMGDQEVYVGRNKEKWSWVKYTFYHLPLEQILTNLNRIELTLFLSKK